MKVALNASVLSGPRTGIGRYVAELARGLPRYCELRTFRGQGWRVASLDDCATPNAPPRAATAWRRALAAIPGARSVVQQVRQFAFGAGLRRWRPHVYHEPCYLPYAFDGPLVVTAHDASWVHHPETHPRARVQRMNRLLPPALERADRIIVDSAFVAAEMRDIFAVPEHKLRIIHLGVDRGFRPMACRETALGRAPYGLDHGAYLLAVGTLEPRKNLTTLLAAFENMPVALRRRYPLAIAGMAGWGAGLDARRAGRLQREGSLRLLGYVPENNLPGLYAGATLFVYPSLYEGFGLPPLEAMASGVAVIVSDRASLPEVVGQAGRQVSALDVDALTAALVELLEDADARAVLACAGRQRATAFSWEACVRQTAAVHAEFAA